MKMGIAFALLLQTVGSDEVVPFTPVQNAEKRMAVCVDGSEAGYYYRAGSGKGAKSWLLHLRGGGWCGNYNECHHASAIRYGSTTFFPTYNFTGIFSKHQHTNPDFYDWNRVYIYYCDQSSFLGDTEILDQGQKFQFRGSRIFDAVIEDLLEKGINNAENALLSGDSAGGLAAILHCDGFQARFPEIPRVKCLSDAGFFIRGKGLPHAHHREKFYASIIEYHNISNFLPKSCTKRIDPSLCLFPEYLVGNVQTPLFILNSAFDFYQLQANLVHKKSREWARWNNCLNHLQKCTAADNLLLKDFRNAFLKAIKGISSNPSRGLYIHPCFTHSVTMPTKHTDLWKPNSTFRLGNLAISEAVGNWYFDRGSVNLIEDLDFLIAEC